MGNLFEGPHLLVIAIVILLLFGSKKIPEFMAGLGKGIREFKKATHDIEDEVRGTADKQTEKTLEEKTKTG
jgi:TatA/E family protein of Tat protein translocase